MRNKILASLVFSLLIFLLAVPSFAQDSTTSTDLSPTASKTPKREAVKDRIQNVRENTREKIETVRENTKARLDASKLRACQAREASINKRIEILGRLSTTILTKFSNITDRVIEFYNNKIVAEETLPNYDELISNINDKKEAVSNAISAAQGDSFSCESDDPKGQLRSFRDHMQDVKAALQEYRSAIKDLIVAIRNLNSEPESSE